VGHHNLAGVLHIGQVVVELHAGLAVVLHTVLGAAVRHTGLGEVLEVHHTGLVVVVGTALGEEHNLGAGAGRHIGLEVVRRTGLVVERRIGREVAAGRNLAEADIRRTVVDTALGVVDNLVEGVADTAVDRNLGEEGVGLGIADSHRAVGCSTTWLAGF
jgi:hypothetical protein